MSNQIFPALKGFDIDVDRAQVFSTMIQTAPSGKEQRASWWTAPRYKWQVQVNFARQAGFSTNTPNDELGTLHAFFMQHRGSWDSFLYADPYDSTDTAMWFGVGTGAQTAFQLQRREPGTITTSGGTVTINVSARPSDTTCYEPVTEPAPGIQIYKAGVLMTLGTDYTIATGGIITFAIAPASGADLTYTGAYYRRVRFDMDEMDFQRFMSMAWGPGNNSSTLNLISVK